MTTPSEKYQKIIRWLLSNINPETQGIQASLNLLCARHAPQLPPLASPTSSDLLQVLESVRAIEARMVALTRHLLPAWHPPPSSDTHGTIQSIMDESSFEKVFARLLPCIDASLSVTEESMCAANDGLCRISLEPVPPADVNETAAKRQVRFVEKAKRIHVNLALLEEALQGGLSPPDAASPSRPGGVRSGGAGGEDSGEVRLLYQPPAWSTPSQQAFCLELREGDVVLHEFPLAAKGHFLIGRLPLCDVVIDDATCSRQHAVIQFRPGDPDPASGQRKDEVYIYDLGSTSGTYVNGMALQPSAYYPLFVADLLQFGQYPLSFMLRQRASSARPLSSSLTFYPSASASGAEADAYPAYVTQPAPSPLGDEPSLLGEDGEEEGDELGPRHPPSSAAPSGGGRRKAPMRANTTPSRVDSTEQQASSLSNINRLLSVSVGKQSALAPAPSPQASSSSSHTPLPHAQEATPAPVQATASQPAPNLLENAPSSQGQGQGSHGQGQGQGQGASPQEASEAPVGVSKSMSEPPALENREKASAGGVNPRNPNFNEEEYKQKMMEAYERQQAENAEILRKRKEREAAGLPPIVEIPYVPERPRRNTATPTPEQKKKKKRWWNR